MSEENSYGFERTIKKCPYCKKKLQEHIIKEGARYHVLHWDKFGEHCSEENCEINHKCKKAPKSSLSTFKSDFPMKYEKLDIDTAINIVRQIRRRFLKDNPFIPSAKAFFGKTGKECIGFDIGIATVLDALKDYKKKGKVDYEDGDYTLQK